VTLAQLLKRVRELPPHQRNRLEREIRALRGESVVRRRTRRVKWPDVEARAKRVFGDRVLPNLVLLERGEEPS
jgi:hypothetical protein